MRVTQTKAGSVVKFNDGYKRMDYNEAVRLGMQERIKGSGSARSTAKTKAGRLNLIRRVHAKMVREGQIIPPIGDA